MMTYGVVWLDYHWSKQWLGAKLLPETMIIGDNCILKNHYNDVKISAIVSQIIGASIVCSTACSGAYQRMHQSFASLAFVRGIHRWPVNSPHKGPVTRKMLPFDGVIMKLMTLKFELQYKTFLSRTRKMRLEISSAKCRLSIWWRHHDKLPIDSQHKGSVIKSFDGFFLAWITF